jgi:hypothetical protein
MAQLEKVNLLLQNLVYEQNHYENEISAARAFVFDADALQLWSEEELLARAPTAFDAASTASTPVEHAHRVMLARLSAELDERKRLQARVEALKHLCAQKHQANAELEKFLGGLSGQLRQLTASSAALRALLAQAPAGTDGAPDAYVAQIVPADERAAAAALPPPLYSLFVHVRGFRDAVDADIDARIDGDVAAALLVNSTPTSSSSSSSSSDTRSVTTSHPMCVVVEVPLEAGNAARQPIRFHWLPRLQLVAAFMGSRE